MPILDNADIRQAGGVIGSDGDVPRNVGHVVIDPRVPAHDDLRVEVAETGDGVADAVEAGNGNVPNGVPKVPDNVLANEVAWRP
jgi:hypothetical protein